LVTNGECELGIVSYPNRLRGLQHHLLREEALVFVASPEHALAHGYTELQVESLAGQSMLSLEASLPLAREIRQYLRRHHIAIAAGDTFDNIDTLLHALGPSRRCAILPEQTVLSAVEAGQVVTRPLAPALTRPVGIIHSGEAQVSLLAEAFMQEIESLVPAFAGQDSGEGK
jgi:DNA-binding transcriptional LysR family regulator